MSALNVNLSIGSVGEIGVIATLRGPITELLPLSPSTIQFPPPVHSRDQSRGQ